MLLADSLTGRTVPPSEHSRSTDEVRRPLPSRTSHKRGRSGSVPGSASRKHLPQAFPPRHPPPSHPRPRAATPLPVAPLHRFPPRLRPRSPQALRLPTMLPARLSTCRTVLSSPRQALHRKRRHPRNRLLRSQHPPRRAVPCPRRLRALLLGLPSTLTAMVRSRGRLPTMTWVRTEVPSERVEPAWSIPTR
jgi:hypothetical protein